MPTSSIFFQTFFSFFCFSFHSVRPTRSKAGIFIDFNNISKSSPGTALSPSSLINSQYGSGWISVFGSENVYFTLIHFSSHSNIDFSSSCWFPFIFVFSFARQFTFSSQIRSGSVFNSRSII